MTRTRAKDICLGILARWQLRKVTKDGGDLRNSILSAAVHIQEAAPRSALIRALNKRVRL